MNTLVNTPSLGMERIARETLIILIETLNDELAKQEELWAPLDEELAFMRTVDYVPITQEPVAPDNFYLGHKPSLIKAEIDRYPNVCVMADQTGPAPNDDIDQMFKNEITLWIEIMVRSSNSEEEVNARVERMLDAVNICMMSNRTLRGIVNEIGDAPDAGTSDVNMRKERTAYGPEWFWQGARIEYAVVKEAIMPSGSFREPAALHTGIDQPIGGAVNG